MGIFGFPQSAQGHTTTCSSTLVVVLVYTVYADCTCAVTIQVHIAKVAKPAKAKVNHSLFMANIIYPIIIFNDSNVNIQLPSVLEETLPISHFWLKWYS